MYAISSYTPFCTRCSHTQPPFTPNPTPQDSATILSPPPPPLPLPRPTAPKRPRINQTTAPPLILARHGRQPKHDVPAPLKHPAGEIIPQLRLDEPAPVRRVRFPRPPPHRLGRDGELRAAGRHQVRGAGAAEPGRPEGGEGGGEFGLDGFPVGGCFVGFAGFGGGGVGEGGGGGWVADCFFVILRRRGADVVVEAVVQRAAEVLVASCADGGQVEVVDLGGGVGALVPGVFVAVAEDGDGGEVVVVVDDEGEVAHGFVAFVLFRPFSILSVCFFPSWVV